MNSGKKSRKNSSGFSLVVVIAYTFLMSFIAMLLFAWVSNSHRFFSVESARATDAMITSAAIDLLYRDLLCAPGQLNAWHHATNKEIIFNIGDRCVGWKNDGKNLYRYEGIYQDSHWKTHTKSLVHENVTAFSCACVACERRPKEYTAVVIALNNTTIKVALRNGWMHE